MLLYSLKSYPGLLLLFLLIRMSACGRRDEEKRKMKKKGTFEGKERESEQMEGRTGGIRVGMRALGEGGGDKGREDKMKRGY